MTTTKLSATALRNLKIVSALTGKKQYQVLESLLAEAAAKAKKDSK